MNLSSSMETALLSKENVQKAEPVTLISPRNPEPVEIMYLSNMDQTVAFNVETVFFYEVPEGAQEEASHVIELVRQAISDVLLIPYYFLAGRHRFNFDEGRLELICNNNGVLFVGAISNLRLKELGNLSFPNPSFHHLIVPIEGFQNLADTPLFSIQVTRFRCGGFSIGFVVNHSILDGRSAAEMFLNLASICRGEGLKIHELNTDRSCIRARNPPQIKFNHTEYTNLSESSSTSFTSPAVSSKSNRFSQIPNFALFSFSSEMIKRLKNKSEMKCSSFEAIVAHLWRSRTRSVFDDPSKRSSVLFAVDIRSKMSPPLPLGFIGNAVITASASAEAGDLGTKSFAFACALDGNFFVSAWWKLPFHELDFGFGNPRYGGPVVSGKEEFVLLLSDGGGMEKEKDCGINVWIALDREKMEKFESYVFEI